MTGPEDPTPAPPAKGRRRWPLWLAAGLAVGVLGVVGLGHLANRQASAAVDRFLRRRVFTDPAALDYDRFSWNIWTGRLEWQEVRWARPQPPLSRWEARLPRVWTKLPVRSLLGGGPAQIMVRVEAPFLTHATGLALPVPDKPVPGSLPPGLVAQPFWKLLGRAPPTRVEVAEGTLAFEDRRRGRALTMAVDRLSLALAPSGSPRLEIQGSGRVTAGPPAPVDLLLKIDQAVSPYRFEGRLEAEGVSLPEVLEAIGPADAEWKLTSGRLTLRVLFQCVDDRLTMTHLVKLEDFHLEVPPTTKRILGVSVKRLKHVFDFREVSFTVPVSGPIDDPGIGFAVAVQQIVYGLLSAQDPEGAEVWSKRAGAYVGARADRAWRRWLSTRRGRPEPTAETPGWSF